MRLNYKSVKSDGGTFLQAKLSARLLLRWLLRMTSVDLFHDPLSPADAVRYGSYGSRNLRSAVVLRQFTGRQNRGGDEQHALSTLTHLGSLTLSSYIRHAAATMRRGTTA